LAQLLSGKAAVTGAAVQPGKSGDGAAEPDSGYWRLEQQIRWYDDRSLKAQFTFKWLRRTQIVVAALVPTAALIFPTQAVIPGLLGALILILVGFQELGAYQRNWIKYRSTCETLRHETYLYLGQTGRYQGLDEDDAHRQLVERVEAMVTDEHTQWTTQMDPQHEKEAGTAAKKAAAARS
jgi:hypothetical protein